VEGGGVAGGAAGGGQAVNSAEGSMEMPEHGCGGRQLKAPYGCLSVSDWEGSGAGGRRRQSAATTARAAASRSASERLRLRSAV
jgi:hypothetical protein